jgi:hypothetical protein
MVSITVVRGEHLPAMDVGGTSGTGRQRRDASRAVS